MKTNDDASQIEKAIEFIWKRGIVSGPDIAAHLDIPNQNVQPALQGPIRAGYLVKSKTGDPGSHLKNQYAIADAVIESGATWKEFLIAKKAGLKLEKAATTRSGASKKIKDKPAAATKESAPPEVKRSPAEVRNAISDLTSVWEKRAAGDLPDSDADVGALPAISAVRTPAPDPDVVFMIDSKGRLRIEMYGGTTVCSTEETNALGLLMISAEPIWSHP